MKGFMKRLMFNSENYVYYHKCGGLYDGTFLGINKSECRRWESEGFPGTFVDFAKVCLEVKMNATGKAVVEELNNSWKCTKDMVQCAKEFFTQVKPFVMKEFPEENHFYVLFSADDDNKGVLLTDDYKTMRSDIETMNGTKFSKVIDNVCGAVEVKIYVDTDYTSGEIKDEDKGFINSLLLEIYISKDNNTCLQKLTYESIDPKYLDELLEYKWGEEVAVLTNFEKVSYLC